MAEQVVRLSARCRNMRDQRFMIQHSGFSTYNAAIRTTEPLASASSPCALAAEGRRLHAASAELLQAGTPSPAGLHARVASCSACTS